MGTSQARCGVRTAVRTLVSMCVMAAAIVVGVVVGPSAAHADACYTWGRTLRSGMSGSDVTQLQIRMAGWVAYKEVLTIDGSYGSHTASAVTRFQAAYGLTQDGVAGPQTFNKIYALQDADCSPVHFSFYEMNNNCGRHNFLNSSVASEATAKSNALRVMWKLEAMRHKLGDHPMTVTSGFRDDACNAASGGASNSLHRYGAAADVVASSFFSLCDLDRTAIRSGFSEVLGPGYPDHNDHAHMANKTEVLGGSFFSAPNCSNFP
jgi:zinc D-Ala-D-Ala carboxypeptidase